jgi:signal transduction histidine kinase
LKRIILASVDLVGFLANEAEPDATAIAVDRRGKLLAVVRGSSALRDLIQTDISTSNLFGFATAHPEGGVAELTGFNGKREVWAVAPQPHNRDPGLFILTGRSKTELVAPANRRLREEGLFLLLLSLALVGGAWLVAEHAIRRPVKRIVGAVRRLGRGDLTTRLEAPIPSGELGELMDAVNVAARSLQSQRDDIETLHSHLRQAQKMEAIGQLTGGIAHDFNNLMTVILGNAEMLSEELADRPELKPLADNSLAAAERAAELTRSLLAFARKQPLRPRSTDINELLSRMRPIIDRSIGQQIVCSFVLAPDAWPALVDPTQLESAVLNLAINARDAMDGGGHLVISSDNLTLDAAKAAALEGSVPGDYVTINVIDTGTGMSDDVQHEAFEPFFTTKEVGKGSGLGLSMVYGFVKQSDGYVRLDSAPGRGTKVTLYLPRAKD